MFNIEFTEEEYQNIIKNFNSARGNLSQRLNTVLEKFYEEFPMRLRDGVDDFIIIAFINPITSNDAHERFVVKEKRYVWRSKRENSVGKEKRLYDTADGISDSFIDKDTPSHNGNRITETEVKKWGYNPEMFNKEEV